MTTFGISSNVNLPYSKNSFILIHPFINLSLHAFIQQLLYTYAVFKVSNNSSYSFFDTDFSGLFGMLKLVLMTAISRVSKPSNYLFHPKSKWFGYKTMQMCMCVCFLYLMLEMWGDPPALLLLDVM